MKNPQVYWAAKMLYFRHKKAGLRWCDAIAWAWQCWRESEPQRVQIEKNRLAATVAKQAQWWENWNSEEAKFKRRLAGARHLPQDRVSNSREYDGSGGVFHVVRRREDRSDVMPTLQDDPYYRVAG